MTRPALTTGQLGRFFAVSAGLTIVAVIGVLAGQGLVAALVMLLLIAIEITFSFENAIINAKIVARLSPAWQRMFLTLGIVIAIFGMRVIFPVLIVCVTAGLSWREVVDLVLHHPRVYAEHLEAAHPAIAAFGGSFLFMLSLYFFFDERRTIRWFKRLERRLQQLERRYLPAVLTIGLISALSLVPANHHGRQTFEAGVLGVLTYVALQLFTHLFERLQQTSAAVQTGRRAAPAALTGWAALSSFVYLEILDASFSFDGVIGAFAVTSSVLLIAVGLGVGAVWVRSLTVFMVRRGTLETYQYLEHGAHYTVAVLALTLLGSTVVDIPEIVAGVAGFVFIGWSVYASRRSNQAPARAA